MPPMTYRPLLVSILMLTLAACGGQVVRWQPPPATPALGAVGSVTAVGERIASTAERMLGVPYRYGGKGTEGFDCSGLVFYSHRAAGRRVPRTTRGQFRAARPISMEALRPGDVLFFDFEDKIGHVAIYTGDGEFVHAPSSGKRVSRASLENRFWRSRLVSAGRLYHLP